MGENPYRNGSMRRAQYITYRVDGNDKIPTHPIFGFDINPHDPRNWTTREAAYATGRPVGYVLTADDDNFFIDLDKCVVDGQWTPMAVAVMQRFAGAAMETSRSGQGAHIVGRYDRKRLDASRYRNKVDGWIEFYAEGRFIAFGGGEWVGDSEQDCTDALLGFLTPRPEPIAAESAGHCPVPDDVVLERLLKARSAGSMFDGTPAPADLWEARRDVLARQYPPIREGEPFDHSGADAALLQHLAYWCQRDAGMMERLFSRSVLGQRDKWKRDDYRARSIDKAVRQQVEIANWAGYGAPDKPAEPGTEPPRPYLTIPDQLAHFAGCTYVTSVHRVLVPSGALLKPEQFNALYGGHEFAMQPDGGRPTRRAFEAFTESRAHKFPKAFDTCFRPDLPFGAIVSDAVNIYQPRGVEPVEGDVTPFLDHLAKLLPVESDRATLLQWCAACVQRPGKLIRWAPVLQGTEGNGKTFIFECVAEAVGRVYYHKVRPEQIGSQFNGYVRDKLLLVVEEIDVRDKRAVLEVLKPMITDRDIEIERKGVDQARAVNVANWGFCTNHKGGMLTHDSDRRYAIFHTAQQSVDDLARDGMSERYFSDLYDWAQRGGYAAVTHYLRSLDVSGLPGRAPATSSTVEAVRESLGNAEQAVLEAIAEGRAGCRGNYLSGWAVRQILEEQKISPAPRTISRVIKNLGYREIMRASNPVPFEGGARPIIYATGLVAVDFTSYAYAQGYQGVLRRTT